MESNRNKRSLGVTIFGWFFILSSLAGVSQVLPVLNKTGIPAVNSFFILVEFVFNSACFFIGLGILALDNNFRKSAIYYAILLFILSMVEALVFPSDQMIAQVIVKIFGIVIIFIFFTRPKVREQFI